MTEAAHLAFAMGCVLAVWGGLLLLFSGLGRGLLRALYGRAKLSPGLATSCWLGYAAAVAVLQVWHLLLPVDGRALAALAAVSAVGWVAARTAPVRRQVARVSPAALVALALGALWLADRAVGPVGSYDSANYHLTLVRWFHRFAIVPGLANLSPVYGVNLSGLLVPALLEAGPGTGRSSHFANGFVVFLLLFLLTRLLGRRAADDRGAAPAQVAAVWFLYPAITQIHRADGSWISSLATDVPITMAVLAACALTFEALEETPAGEGGPAGLDPRLFTALALLAVAPGLKSTATVFAAAAWLVLVGSWIRLHGPRQALRSRPFAGAVLFATVAIGAWLARNAVLSGYPLFPAPLGGLGVDWRLPAEHVEGVVWWTRAYTRTPAAWDLMVAQHGASWLPYWLRAELRTALHEVLVPLALTASWIVLWLAAGRPPRPPRQHRPPLLLVPLAVAIPAWFLLAPATRYGMFLFWILCAQVAALYLHPVVAGLPRRRLAIPAMVLVAVATPLALHAYYTVKYRGTDPPAAALRRTFWTSPGSDHGFHPLYRPVLDRLTVCRDLDVFVPAARAGVRGEAPWPDTLPWDGPLPATALLYEGLCPRRPGDLGAGFRTEDRGLSWSERNAATVAEVQRRTGWGLGRLAVYFCVRPELIEASLRTL
jgi:hypothetical protein